MSAKNSPVKPSQLTAGAILRDSRDQILIDWERRARSELRAASHELQLTLLNSLPHFIDELIQSLEANYPRLVASEDVAIEHAEQRVTLTHFDLSQVLSEYDILSRAILNVLDKHPIVPTRVERDIILEFIQRGKKAAAVRYLEIARQREEEITSALRRSEELHRQTFEQAAVGMAHLDLHGQWIKVNQRLCDILQYSRDELLKLTFQDITHPDDLQADLALVNQLLIGAIPHYQMEKRYLRKDKSTVWVELTVSLVRDCNEKPLYFISVIEDISDRKVIESSLRETHRKAEEALSALNAVIESSPIGIAIFGRDLTYIRANRVLAAINNRVPEEIIGRSIFEVLPENLAKEIEERIQFVFKTGKPILNVETSRIDVVTGKLRTFLVTLFPLRNETYTWAVGLKALEITKRKEIEERLRNSLKLLKEEQDLRERVFSMISHDLRTPLTSAKLSVQALIRSKSQDEISNCLLKKLASSLDRADNMIQDLLDANRINAGKSLPIHVISCDFIDVVASTVEELRHIHGNARFELLKDEKPILGHWDCNGVRRILENLCINAVKYGAENSRIQIRVWQPNTRNVCLTVHNEGNPISQNELPTLFEPFTRSKSAQDSDKKGWGVGLALVKGVVEAHHGSIEVRSTEKEGTTFTVNLPMDARAH
jgi:PAS domain S-box-containing protein